MTDLKPALEIMAETFKDFSEISRKQYLNINDHYFLGKEDAYDLATRYVENLIEIHFAKENGERVMERPTNEEMMKLVDFERDVDGTLFVKNVKGSVLGYVEGDVGASIQGSVSGNIYGHVGGRVCGTVNGRKWQFVETPKEKAIRLIREGKSEEAIKVLEESE